LLERRCPHLVVMEYAPGVTPTVMPTNLPNVVAFVSGLVAALLANLIFFVASQMKAVIYNSSSTRTEFIR
jgi:hypothetical protein